MPLVSRFEISPSSQGEPLPALRLCGRDCDKTDSSGLQQPKDVTVLHKDISDDQLAGLVRRTAEANSALIRGDVSRYLTLITHADDQAAAIARS